MGGFKREGSSNSYLHDVPSPKATEGSAPAKRGSYFAHLPKKEEQPGAGGPTCCGEGPEGAGPLPLRGWGGEAENPILIFHSNTMSHPWSGHKLPLFQNILGWPWWLGLPHSDTGPRATLSGMPTLPAIPSRLTLFVEWQAFNLPVALAPSAVRRTRERQTAQLGDQGWGWGAKGRPEGQEVHKIPRVNDLRMDRFGTGQSSSSCP